MVTLGLLIFSQPSKLMWSAVKLLNFYYMPLPYQVILNTTFAVAFNLYFNVLKRVVTQANQEIAIREGQFIEQ